MYLAGVAYTQKVPLFPCLLCGIIFIPAFSESSTPMEEKIKPQNKQNNKPLNLPLDSRTLELLGSSYWLKWIKERLPAAGEGNWAGRSEEEQWSKPFSALGLSKPTVQAKGRALSGGDVSTKADGWLQSSPCSPARGLNDGMSRSPWPIWVPILGRISLQGLHCRQSSPNQDLHFLSPWKHSYKITGLQTRKPSLDTVQMTTIWLTWT